MLPEQSEKHMMLSSYVRHIVTCNIFLIAMFTAFRVKIKLSSFHGMRVSSHGSTQITAKKQIQLSLIVIITVSPVTLTQISVHCSKVVFNSPYMEVLSAADTSSLISWEESTRPYHHVCHIFFLSIIPNTPHTCKEIISKKYMIQCTCCLKTLPLYVHLPFESIIG